MCVFCENQQGRYLECSNGTINRIILEDQYWAIMPTLGAFVEGYVLHVLKRHTQASYFCSKNEIDSLEDNITAIHDTYKRTYGTEYACIFEHGAIKEEYKSACCINHTHIHMLPSKYDVYEDVTKYLKVDRIEVSTLAECYEIIRHSNMSSYIMFGNPILAKYSIVNTSENVCPSQYLRQVLYKILVGSSLDYGWDWRKNFYYDVIKKTVFDLRQTLN